MKIGIIGAGPSGLNYAKCLGFPSIIFEREPFVGGTANSFKINGYTFDYGPHIIFSKNSDILKYMVDMLGDNVTKCVRKNRVSFEGQLINYPFENGIAELPSKSRYKLLSTYFDNPNFELINEPKNLEQWFYKHFGTNISNSYLIPYNEKVWNLPVPQLSMDWADRIPMPNVQDMLKSACGIQNDGYLHQLYYHYPTHNGFSALVDCMAKGLEVNLNEEVKLIELASSGKFVVESNVGRYDFEFLASSLPLPELVKICKFHIPNDVLDAIDNLLFNPILIVSLGVRGFDPDKYTAIYFPESDFLVNRISFPATFSQYNAPDGCYSIQAEITCVHNSKVWSMTDSEITAHVINGLSDRNLVDRDSIELVNVCRKRYAYVVYDEGYNERVDCIRNWFRENRISLIGRFGYFEYLNVDGIIMQTRALANKFLDSLGKEQK